MKRLFVPFAAVGLIVLLVAGYVWYAGRTQATPDAPADDPLIEAATLAIKGIRLFQGEQGFEFWRLKAEWAAMNEDQGVIDVRDPVVRYTLGEPEKQDYVHARSKFGRVTDERTVLTMWDDVTLKRGTDTLAGPRMIYRTDERVVLFPEGGHLDRPSMTGLFTVLRWDMDSNTIEAEQGVDITFDAGIEEQVQATPEQEQAKPDAGETGHAETEAANADSAEPTERQSTTTIED